MASIRELKKDINYLAYELLTEILAYRHFHPETEDEKTNSLIKKIVSQRNELIARINQRDGLASGKEIKTHFSKIRTEMIELIQVLADLQEA
jgi:hypothetical protein